MSEAEAQPLSQPLVLYDGQCALCHATVRWLLAHDTQRVLRFAPLQGKTAAHLRDQGLALPQGLESVVLVTPSDDREAQVLVRSRAVLALCDLIGYRSFSVRLLRLLPRAATDAVYRVVAATRYRIFGRRACLLPPEAERDRFLS